MGSSATEVIHRQFASTDGLGDNGEVTFSQSAVETVYLGKAATAALHQEIRRTASHRVVIIASNTLATTTTCISGLQKALGDRYAGTFASIPAHSPLDSIIEAVRYARCCRADFLVAVGGGSVIDAAKIVTLCLERDLDAIEDLLALRIGGQTPDRDYPSIRARVQLIVIPTTLSGAEFNDVAAATDHESRQKIGFKHRALAPRAIILDPAMSLHTPMRLWCLLASAPWTTPLRRSHPCNPILFVMLWQKARCAH